MRVAFITEGTGEFQGFPRLRAQFQQRAGVVMLPPMLLKVPPEAPQGRIARECKVLVKLAISNSADLVVVIIDREGRNLSPKRIAADLENELARHCSVGPELRVVVKDRTFENWLIADLAALKDQPARFTVSESLRRAVEPEKADHVNALELLKRATIGRSYHKTDDGLRICARMNVGNAGLHSRSFRHLLHVLGDAEFEANCCRQQP